MLCGTTDSTEEKDWTTTNCAIALAVRDIFPKAEVFASEIIPFGMGPEICLPDIASDFIKEFDNFKNDPKARLLMPEISFEIDVPMKVIEKIGIREAYKVLSESRTLELVKI